MQYRNEPSYYSQLHKTIQIEILEASCNKQRPSSMLQVNLATHSIKN